MHADEKRREAKTEELLQKNTNETEKTQQGCEPWVTPLRVLTPEFFVGFVNFCESLFSAPSAFFLRIGVHLCPSVVVSLLH